MACRLDFGQPSKSTAVLTPAVILIFCIKLVTLSLTTSDPNPCASDPLTTESPRSVRQKDLTGGCLTPRKPPELPQMEDLSQQLLLRRVAWLRGEVTDPVAMYMTCFGVDMQVVQVGQKGVGVLDSGF